MTYRAITSILFLWVFTLPTYAQLQPKNLVKHWSLKDGLSQGVINSATQDDQSLIWFATEDGLNRFDGYTFKYFNTIQTMGKVLPITLYKLSLKI